MIRPHTLQLGAVRTATGGILRHRVQALVIGSVLLISTASATLGFALLAAVNAPYQRAFNAQKGADAAVVVDTSRADAGQLAATGSLGGVTAVAGPFTETTVQIQFDGRSLGPRTLAGRASPGGPVDDVLLNEGSWPDGPGQVVLDSGPGGGPGFPGVGSTVTVTGAPGVQTLTVTGFATSITKSADGWVTPGEAALLQAPGTPAAAQMLYQFADAGTAAQISTDISEISRSLPAGTVLGHASWLTSQSAAAGNAAIMEPFLVAFALIGLAIAVLIVGNVVSGAVVAQYHRIGILKSIGLTPAQVVAAYLIRVGWPALAGCLAGVAAGNMLAIPVLRKSDGFYGVGHQQVPWWASLAALAGMLLLTALAALGPALRAGRLSAVQAIAAGRAPRAGRGYAAHRLTARLRLPRPAGIGLAAPFARPARTAVTLAAIAFGAAAVIFAVGLHSALSRAEASQTLSATAPVQIQKTDPDSDPGPTAQQDAAVTAALRAQPSTLRYVPVYSDAVKAASISQSVETQAFGGGGDSSSSSSSWLGYAVSNGRWYDQPGEVDVNTTFLADSGLSVGDSTTLDVVGTGNAAIRVRIVGEVFYPSNSPWLFTGAQTLPGVTTTQNLQDYDVGLRPGTSAAEYVQAVDSALGADSPWQAAIPQGSAAFGIAGDLISLLAIMVAVAAGLGVFNTVLMTTRDRVHDLGVFKAIGMRPSQMLTMVVCQVAVPAVVAAAIAIPIAQALTTATVQAMASTAHSDVPASFTQVFPASRLALLSLGALAIALLGALLPAGWAARARPAAVLRTE
jgi:putative ABC transport system permease protein